MFWNKSFIFNGIPSETYNLRILNFDAGGSGESSAMGDPTIIQKWIQTRKKPYLFYVAYNSPLEFDFEIANYDPLTSIDRSLISKWLLGKQSYLPLRIVADNMMDAYFNVIFSNPTYLYVGNVNYGMRLHAVCDAPWAWTTEKTLSLTFDGSSLQDYDFTFYNDSDDKSDYLYPTISFKISNHASAGNFSLTNSSDNSREFSFSGLYSLEEIDVDNDRQIINTSSSSLRLSNFNKNWFRLVPGRNTLNISGYLTSFSMDYSFPRIIGG